MAKQGKMGGFIRGLVQAVFLFCYAAFMWASIHKVAFFFGNFEADQSNAIGSYSLAVAFDVTALVITVGVMYFRKSMPIIIQIFVWAFIIGIASFSYFVNWEYDAHFQSTTLTMVPTGQVDAIFDKTNTLRYVPEMRQNTNLLDINPLLASGFTIFSLIYSVIAEFFGTKPPTVDELKKQKAYLEETKDLKADIHRLTENETNKKSHSILEIVSQGRNAWDILTGKNETNNETMRQHENETKNDAKMRQHSETPLAHSDAKMRQHNSHSKSHSVVYTSVPVKNETKNKRGESHLTSSQMRKNETNVGENETIPVRDMRQNETETETNSHSETNNSHGENETQMRQMRHGVSQNETETPVRMRRASRENLESENETKMRQRVRQRKGETETDVETLRLRQQTKRQVETDYDDRLDLKALADKTKISVKTLYRWRTERISKQA